MTDMLTSVLSNQDSGRLKQVTTHLLDSLHTYFDKYAEFDPVRFPATALTSACENPLLPLSVLEQIVRVPVWIFTIDAVIDERLWPEPVIRERLALYEAIACGRRDVDFQTDAYSTVLADIRRSVEAQPHFTELRSLWEECYLKMIDGMLFEALDSPANPDLSVYIDHGTYSIGLPLYVVSTWILQLEENDEPNFHNLTRMMQIAATCVRLANDLRTYEKEKLENNLNAVILTENQLLREGKEPAVASQLARQFVQHMLREKMQSFRDLRSDEEPLNTALSRLTEFSVGFYNVTDFHIVSPDELADMMGIKEGDLHELE